MARLQHPTAGTVVDIEGDLFDRYRASGWLEPGQQQAASEEPKNEPIEDAPATRSNTRRKA